MKFSTTFSQEVTGNPSFAQVLTSSPFVGIATLLTHLGEYTNFEDTFPAVKETSWSPHNLISVNFN